MPAETLSKPWTGKTLIQQKRLRQKLDNVSAMWLFRHKDELPPPLYIGGRRFWLEAEIDAYIDEIAAARNALKVGRDRAP